MDQVWLEISNEDASSEDLVRRIHERLASREKACHSVGAEDPKSAADSLWAEMVTDSRASDGKTGIPIRSRDCDIVPRGYEIGWRVPVVGRIHAVVRRIITDEIRRYLHPSLEKQSAINRVVLQALEDLGQENARLRQEVESLRGRQRE